MTIKKLYLSFILVGAFFASNNFAHAQQSCAKVFIESPYSALQKLSNVSEDFLEMYKNMPEQIDVASFEAKLRELEGLHEAYFKAAGITFQKMGRMSGVKGLKDSGYYMAMHGTYKITGTADGNEVSRMLYGLQIHPELKDHPVTILLDPLYRINHTDSYGHFIAEGSTIRIGSHAFVSNLMGLGDTLRHEVQHYMEQVKIKKGEMTLARMVLKNPDGDAEIAYSDYLRVDEIETHLRDLRFLTNTQKMNKIDENMKATTIKDVRAMMVVEEIQNQYRYISDSKKVLTEIKKSLSKNSFWEGVKFKNKGEAVTMKITLAKGAYPEATLDLTGLIKPEEVSDRAKLKEAILKHIEWSFERIATLEAEVNRMESRL